MPKHSWQSRTIPPFVVIAVVASVWYALESRPQPVIAVPTQQLSDTPVVSDSTDVAVAASSTALPSVSPTVTKLGTEVRFSVSFIPLAKVQKVEYYVENQFVGAAYSKPFSVAVSENNLTTGTHTVVAKIYTTDTTAQSQPATFQAQPTSPPTSATDAGDPQSATGTTPPTSPSLNPPTTPAALTAPADVTATASADGVAATISWTTVDGAVKYQVWRDNALIASPTGIGYTDTGLNPGQTYDYQIVAVDATGAGSSPSTLTAITMPTPPDTTMGASVNEPQDAESPQAPAFAPNMPSTLYAPAANTPETAPNTTSN